MAPADAASSGRSLLPLTAGRRGDVSGSSSGAAVVGPIPTRLKLEILQFGLLEGRPALTETLLEGAVVDMVKAGDMAEPTPDEAEECLDLLKE